jgi:hypothetical protein
MSLTGFSTRRYANAYALSTKQKGDRLSLGGNKSDRPLISQLYTTTIVFFVSLENLKRSMMLPMLIDD